MKRFTFSALAMAAGGVIYLCWREESLLMFSWCDQLHVRPVVVSLRSCAVALGKYPPDWILYSIPNALWVFSGTLVFLGLWGRHYRIERYVWVSTFLAIALGAELAQWVHFLPGSFDLIDLSLNSIFAGFALAMDFAWEKPKKEAYYHGSLASY